MVSSDLEQRVRDLEKGQERLSTEIRHIDNRLNSMDSTLTDLDNKLDTTNFHLATLTTTGELAKQHSSGNEKLIWGLIMFAGAALSFVVGKWI